MRVRRLTLRVTVLLSFATGGLACTSGQAQAALSYPFDGNIAPASGSFGHLEANSVAVNDFNGETYVADSRSGVVNVFETASRTQVANLPSFLTPAGSFGGRRVAVAANDGTGEVYVVDTTDDVIDVFTAAGGYLCQITGRTVPSASECNGGAGSATPAGHFAAPTGVAIDQATGEVYLLDAESGVVDVFSVAGAYLRQIPLSAIPGGFSMSETRSVAVDHGSSHVYLADSNTDVVYEFSTTGTYLSTWTGASTPAGSFGRGDITVAADDASGDVYVGDGENRVTDIFDVAGTYLARFTHVFVQTRDTAVDQATGKVYSGEEGISILNEPSLVAVNGPAVVTPDVATGSATEVGAAAVTLTGAVKPDSVALTACRFEYVQASSFAPAAPDPYEAGNTAPCVPSAGAIPADSGEHAVTARISGLIAGTIYHYRLVAANTHGSTEGNDAQVATVPVPVVENTAATSVTSESAVLNATINPEGADTTYQFEWGPTSAYGNQIPVTAEDIGQGSSGVVVKPQAIAGLSPNVTYHWRVVAVNTNGTSVPADHTFVYATTGEGLPDGRAYEMVTPVHKNGALIGSTLGSVLPQVSADGSRVIAPSIQCFGGAESCTGSRETEGAPYMFVRTGAGWITKPLAPPATQFDISSSWLASADAETALYSMPVPPQMQDDFYARQANGSFVDIGPSSPPAAGEQGVAFFGKEVMVSTADMSRLVYETEHKVWPFDESKPEGTSVYEYAGTDNAAPLLVGVSGGRGSTDLISTCGTKIGGGGRFVSQYGGLSADGRLVYFTATRCSSGSGTNAGREVPVDSLYARVDEAHTVKVSERAPAGCVSSACLTSQPRAAAFQGASVDGARVFFTSTQQLTDNANADTTPTDTAATSGCAATTGVGGCNLYEADLAEAEEAGVRKPVVKAVVAASAGDSSGRGPRVRGVAAISSDGSHVYFVAQGVLSTETNGSGQRAQAGADNLFVYERDASYPQGRVMFIATLAPTDSGEWSEGIAVANVTPDGRFLVFTSHRGLTGDAAQREGPAQVYRYDSQTGALVRVSVGAGGFNDNGNSGAGDAGIVPAVRGFVLRDGPGRADPTMSDNGAFVFFQSPVGLTPQALNDAQIGTEGSEHTPVYAQNVYEYHDGHVALISDGKDVSEQGTLSGVELIGSDLTGANVFFATADQLVPADTDTQRDYYDARVCEPERGNPCVAPGPAGIPPCLGEACHGTPAGTPGVPGAPTATFSGQGNVASSLSAATSGASPSIMRALKLARALKACRLRRDRHKRVLCERVAHKRYGAVRKASGSTKPRLAGHSRRGR